MISFSFKKFLLFDELYSKFFLTFFPLSPIAFFFGPKPRFKLWASRPHHKRYHQFIELLSQLDHNTNPQHQLLLAYLTLFIQLRDILVNRNIAINHIIQNTSKVSSQLKGQLDIYLSGAISGLKLIRGSIQSGHPYKHTPEQPDASDNLNKNFDKLYLRVIESHDIAIARLQEVHHALFPPCQDQLKEPLLHANTFV